VLGVVSQRARPLPLVCGVLTAALVATLAVLGPAGQAAAAPAGSTPYTNPVSKDFADTFADPSILRGKDGLWYSYGTSDPLDEGEGRVHRIPIARSSDLVNWTHVGDAFTDATLPGWAEPDAGIWAPDVRYVDGEYRMYYVVTQTTVTDRIDDNAVGMATAPSPAGPWTDIGAPVVGPREGNGGFLWTFDPSAVTDTDGSQWLLYGSYNGGVFIRRLSTDGRTATGPETMVAVDNKFEGAYVVRRSGYWYFFGSTANCCAGPTTGYSVHVGRSRDLRGPYLDRQGVPLLASRAGGTPMLVQNGNRWIGAGHNAVVRDLAGRDWIVYHALDRADPYLDGTDGVNERPMLIDRMDWVGGWPYVRSDRGPSEGAQTGPVTRGPKATRFEQGLAGWRTLGSWTTAREADAGRYATNRSSHAALVTTVRQARRLRVEADVRGAAGLVVGSPRSRALVEVSVQPKKRRVELRVAAAGRRGRVLSTSPLPATYDPQDWHALELVVRDRQVHAELSHARLGDPLAVLTARLPARVRGGAVAGATASRKGAAIDNLSVVRAARRITALAEVDVPSTPVPASSDEFDGAALAPGWEWVREDPAAQVSGGAFRWPTQAKDLVGTGNDAGVLLRKPPSGDWTVETKLTIDLGETTVRNFQQGGLIAYVSDDHFARFSHVAIFNTRQTEFGKEMPYAGRLAFGGTIVGPPAETTWLRLTHRLDPRGGEHELRAWSSRDGRDWVKGGVWTLPADADVRVGLVSHGGAGATSQFDYFRTFR